MEKLRFTVAAWILCLLCVEISTLQAQPIEPWQVVSIEMSNDGRYLAVKHEASIWKDSSTYFDGGIWLYDLRNLLSPPLFLRKADSFYTRLLFSPNGEYLAVGGFYRLTVFEVNSGAVNLDLSHSATPIRSDFRRISFSPDSNYLMSFSASYTEDEVSIWDIKTGRRIHAIAAQQNQAHIGQLWLSPDWRQYINWSYVSSETETIHDFDIEQGVGHVRGKVATGASATGVREVGAAFSADSAFFALATWDGKVQVYETDSWTLINGIELHQTPCGESGVSLAFAHTHRWLAVECSWEVLITVWDFERNEVVFRDERYAFREVQFTMNDAYLIANRNVNITEKYALAVWDIEKDFELTLYPGNSPRVHPNGELMAVIGYDSRIWIWNIPLNTLLVILPAPQR